MTLDASGPLRAALEAARPGLIQLSHRIHDHPELGFEEVLASAWLAEALESAGFAVERGAAGMDTAVVGSVGPGPLHVAICAEYDALPGVGHACGHNVICAAALGAGLALAPVAAVLGLKVSVLGTPAEEGGGGKLKFIRAGFFGDVDAAMMVHPWSDEHAEPDIIAVQQLSVTYHGREAHASGFPWRGINAADALVIAQTAIGLLRQQLQPRDQVQGIVTRGGEAPNVIPALTSADYMIRAATRERMEELLERVRACFEAGAMASGATLELSLDTAYSDMRHDHELAMRYRGHAESLGRVFSDGPAMTFSTDMGDVSHLLPSIHPTIAIASGDAVNHQAEFAAACVGPSADQAVVDGALAMALTVLDMATDPALRARLLG